MSTFHQDLKTSMAKEPNMLARLAGLCVLVCALLCLGCGSSHPPATNVPDDCQKWLAGYFELVKAKDTAKIQDLCSVVADRDASELPKGSPDMVRETKKQIAATLLQRIDSDLGTFRSYTVTYCKETVVAKDGVAANAFGEGRHIDIICETKYSKHNARENFVLYKGSKDTALIVEAHGYSRSAL